MTVDVVFKETSLEQLGLEKVITAEDERTAKEKETSTYEAS
jgi:hypothetical protein